MASNLCIELLLDILEITAGKKELVVLSLVSKRWTAPAQKILFRAPVLRTTRQVRAFQAAVDESTEGGQTLASHVRSISFKAGGDVMLYDIASTVILCPKIEELGVHVKPSEPWTDATFEAIRKIRPIKVLRLWTVHPGHASWMLDNLSQINTLHIECGECPSPEESTFPAPSCAFEHVTWRGWVNKRGHWLPRILSRSAGTLCTLDLASAQCLDPEILEKILTTHGPYLKSLSLRGEPLADQEADSYAPALEFCTNLEEFQFSAMPSQSLLVALPSTLQRVRFSMYYFYLDRDLRGLETLNLTSIMTTFLHHHRAVKLVEFGTHEEDDEAPGLANLQRVCQSNGVQFRVYSEHGLGNSEPELILRGKNSLLASADN